MCPGPCRRRRSPPRSKHDTPVNWKFSPSLWARDQLAPPSVVETMAASVPRAPVRKQTWTEGHVKSLTFPSPTSANLAVQLSPPSREVNSKVDGLPASPLTAKHTDAVGQETAMRLAYAGGRVFTAHFDPPSELAMIDPPATTTQWMTEEHETPPPDSCDISGAGSWSHVAPPSVVVKITDGANTVQTLALGHETARGRGFEMNVASTHHEAGGFDVVLPMLSYHPLDTPITGAPPVSGAPLGQRVGQEVWELNHSRSVESTLSSTITL